MERFAELAELKCGAAKSPAPGGGQVSRRIRAGPTHSNSQYAELTHFSSRRDIPPILRAMSRCNRLLLLAVACLVLLCACATAAPASADDIQRRHGPGRCAHAAAERELMLSVRVHARVRARAIPPAAAMQQCVHAARPLPPCTSALTLVARRRLPAAAPPLLLPACARMRAFVVNSLLMTPGGDVAMAAMPDAAGLVAMPRKLLGFYGRNHFGGAWSWPLCTHAARCRLSATQHSFTPASAPACLQCASSALNMLSPSGLTVPHLLLAAPAPPHAHTYTCTTGRLFCRPLRPPLQEAVVVVQQGAQ